jgi:hypothetical protein
MTMKTYKKLIVKQWKKRQSNNFEDKLFTTLKKLAKVEFNPYNILMGTLTAKEKYYYNKMEILTK